MKRFTGFVIVGLLVGWASTACAQTESGNDQCRGLQDPGTVTFSPSFSVVPTVTCTPAAFLAETCYVLNTTTTQFTFECKNGSGQHKAGPMTWSAHD